MSEQSPASSASSTSSDSVGYYMTCYANLYTVHLFSQPSDCDEQDDASDKQLSGSSVGGAVKVRRTAICMYNILLHINVVWW